MAKKNSITLARSTVRNFYDLDELLIDEARDIGQREPIVSFGLPPRPEREYDDALLSVERVSMLSSPTAMQAKEIGTPSGSTLSRAFTFNPSRRGRPCMCHRHGQLYEA